MSDWTQETLAKAAKKDLKEGTLMGYDVCLVNGLDRNEAKAFLRGMIPEEVAFMRILVDHWIDTERPCTPSA